MWDLAMRLMRRLMRQTEWHASADTPNAVMHRWTPHGWERRDMTDEERAAHMAKLSKWAELQQW